jgi:hypothetical protein
MKRTDISSLLSERVSVVLELPKNYKSLENLEVINHFTNGLYSVGNRKLLFEEIKNRDIDLAREQITNLCRLYEFSGSKDTKSFIIFLLDHAPLDIYMKIECVNTLQQNNDQETTEYYFKILKEFREMGNNRPSITLFVDILRWTCKNQLNNNLETNIKWLFNETNLTSEYIFKTIITIQKDTERKAHKSVLHFLFTTFFNWTKESRYKILSSQYLLSNKINIDDTENALLKICNDEKEEYNVRADSADTLLKIGTDKSVKLAKEIIQNLGKVQKSINTIYTNLQNAHDEDIEESVRNFLLDIAGVKEDTNLNFDKITEELNKYCKENSIKNIDELNSSMLRIKLDQLLYPGSQTLIGIFNKIYSIIIKHANKDLLIQRLVEELIDMSSTCSSGHCNRLVNTFSGIDGFNINIGFSKQIQSNIAARLNKAIREIENKEFQEKVLEEMIATDENDERKNFLQFFKTIITNIYQELYKEFVDAKYLEADVFENYFRGGISHFETGKNI